MKIEDLNLEFVTLPTKSYYAFKYGKKTTAPKYNDGVPDPKALSIKDYSWNYQDDGLEYYYLGKCTEDGKLLGGNFCWEERLYTGPDMKKIFKWVTLNEEKFYVVEEVPIALSDNRYRFQYKLVPIIKALKDMGYDIDETQEINQPIPQESSI